MLVRIAASNYNHNSRNRSFTTRRMRYKYEFQLVGFGKYEPVKTEIKEQRSNGFYWVRYMDRWLPAEWVSNQWIFIDDIGIYSDANFDKIHEDRIEEPPYK